MTNTPTVAAPWGLITLACDGDYAHTPMGSAIRANLTIQQGDSND